MPSITIRDDPNQPHMFKHFQDMDTCHRDTTDSSRSLSRKQQPYCENPSASTTTLSTISLSSSTSTISAASADDIDPANHEAAFPAITKSLSSLENENESKDFLNSDLMDNFAARRIRSRSSSYPSVGITSPPSGYSSSPLPVGHVISTTPEEAGYMAIPFEVDLDFFSILKNDEGETPTETAPTLRDELAAIALASNQSTVPSASERAISSTLGSVKESRIEAEIPIVTITSYDADDDHAGSPRRLHPRLGSESSELPPEAYIICMLDAGHFNEHPTKKELKKHLEVPSGMKSRPSSARITRKSICSQRTVFQPVGQAQQPSSSSKSDSSDCECNSLVSLKAELNSEMPPLTKCPHLSCESDLRGPLQRHTKMKSWIKYAICRSKSCLLTHMGRQPSEKTTKNIILFKAFRDMKHTRLASARKPKAPFIYRSLRLLNKPNRP